MADSNSKRKSIEKVEINELIPNLLVEAYRQASEYDRHLTSINWYIASIFVAGIFGALAFVLSQESRKQAIPHSITLVAFLGIFVICIWFLFVRRNRTLSLEARKPAITIEKMLITALGIIGPLQMMEKASQRPKGHELARSFVIGMTWILLAVIALDWGGLGVYTMVVWIILVLVAAIVGLTIWML